MGKSRKNRVKGGQRSDPIAKPVKPPTDPELAALREKSILPVLKDLQSAEPQSRTAAAGAIANIIQDTKCRKLLLREQVVHIVLHETLTDSALESRAAGWEILKLLAEEEEADFCVHLYRIDVLTAIQHASSKITDSINGQESKFLSSPKAEQKFVWSIAESLTSILTALAGAQDDILESIVRNQDIIRFLFFLVASEATPDNVLASGLSCMILLSEDNEQFVASLLGADASKVFEKLLEIRTGEGLGPVLACGVLHNIFSVAQWHDQSPGREGSTDAILVLPLSQTLEKTGWQPETSKTSPSTESREILQLALEILASICTAVQGSLENGNKEEESKGPGDKDTEMDGDADEDSDDEAAGGEDDEMDEDEMDDDELEADMDMVTAADDYPDEVSGIDELPTLKALLQHAVPEATKLFKAISSEDDASSELRRHALTVLNNVSWTISCIDFSEGQSSAILQAWTPVANSIWKETVTPVLASDTSDVELATIVTSLAWAVSRALRERTPIQPGEAKRFISLYHASKNLKSDNEDAFQGLGVKCVGVLGQLAYDPAPITLNREIGVFLLTIVTALPETPAADAVEALNQLFDIYGDEKLLCDKEVFWKDNFLQHLEESLPKVKAMAKKVDKRAATELRSRADETALNLTRFIQYKQKHRP